MPDARQGCWTTWSLVLALTLTTACSNLSPREKDRDWKGAIADYEDRIDKDSDDAFARGRLRHCGREYIDEKIARADEHSASDPGVALEYYQRAFAMQAALRPYGVDLDIDPEHRVALDKARGASGDRLAAKLEKALAAGDHLEARRLLGELEVVAPGRVSPAEQKKIHYACAVFHEGRAEFRDACVAFRDASGHLDADDRQEECARRARQLVRVLPALAKVQVPPEVLEALTQALESATSNRVGGDQFVTVAGPDDEVDASRYGHTHTAQLIVKRYEQKDEVKTTPQTFWAWSGATRKDGNDKVVAVEGIEAIQATEHVGQRLVTMKLAVALSMDARETGTLDLPAARTDESIHFVDGAAGHMLVARVDPTEVLAKNLEGLQYVQYGSVFGSTVTDFVAQLLGEKTIVSQDVRSRGDGRSLQALCTCCIEEATLPAAKELARRLDVPAATN